MKNKIISVGLLVLVIGNSVVIHASENVRAITQSIHCPVCFEDKAKDDYSLLPIFQCKELNGEPFRHFVCLDCMKAGNFSACPECRAPRIINQHQPVALTPEQQQSLQARIATLLETLNGVSADLVGANLIRKDLMCANLTRANLTNANLRGANLIHANLDDVDLRGAYLTNADLRGAYLRYANLTSADLRGANLTSADLRGTNLTSVDLIGVNLTDADLRGTNLTSADLRGANLTNVDLRDADLDGANLDGAYLDGANLRGVNLRGTDLSRVADLEGARFIRTRGLSPENRAYAIAHGAIVED